MGFLKFVQYVDLYLGITLFCLGMALAFWGLMVGLVELLRFIKEKRKPIVPRAPWRLPTEDVDELYQSMLDDEAEADAAYRNDLSRERA